LRRILLLVSAIVFVDTMFYAAIAPLLPFYADRLDLSKGAAGVLSGAYPAGTLLASLPAGWLSARFGSRPVVLAGLVLLGGSSLAFGFAGSIALLDGARFVQGVGGALTWTGGLSWLVNVTPRERRSEVIGTAIGAALGGALLGPVLGAVARSVGPEPTFAVVGALSAGLIAATLRERDPGRERLGGMRALLRSFRCREIADGMLLVVLIGLYWGVLDVLLPLRLGSLGAAGAVVAGTFVAAAALQSIVSPLIGRLADRRGFALPIAMGLGGSALLSLAVPLPDVVAPLVVIGILSGPLVGMLWIPGVALLSKGAETLGLEQAFAFAAMNLAWAGSQALGSGGGGALAGATSDAVPYALVAAAALVSLGVAGARRRHAVPG
jgi:MFS family permease